MQEGNGRKKYSPEILTPYCTAVIRYEVRCMVMTIARAIVLAFVLVLIGTSVYAADCHSGSRYEVLSTGTVQDCRTGLIWLQNAKCTNTLNLVLNPDGYLSWANAMKWVAGLQDGLCGLTDGSAAGDWRLPTKIEWMAMVAYARDHFSNPTITNAAGDAK
jgi:hypothetical protein